MTTGKLFFFALSTLGSFELLRMVGGNKIQIYFLPSLTIAVQVSVLLLAGLWNLLPETALALYLFGFFGLFLRVFREKSLIWRHYSADKRKSELSAVGMSGKHEINTGTGIPS